MKHKYLCVLGLLTLFTIAQLGFAEPVQNIYSDIAIEPEDVVQIPKDSAYKNQNIVIQKYYSFNYGNKKFEWITPKNKDQL